MTVFFTKTTTTKKKVIYAIGRKQNKINKTNLRKLLMTINSIMTERNVKLGDQQLFLNKITNIPP